MVIYLTHTVFSAALRIGLVEVGVTSLPVILVATTAIGLVIPIIVLLGARRMQVAKLLGF